MSKGTASATMLQRGGKAEKLAWHGKWPKWGKLGSERKIDGEKEKYERGNEERDRGWEREMQTARFFSD